MGGRTTGLIMWNGSNNIVIAYYRRVVLALCSILWLLAAAGPAAGQTQNAASAPLSKAEVEQIVKAYLQQHPEVILESVRLHQEKQRSTQEQQAKEALTPQQVALLLRDADSPAPTARIAPAGQEINIVEFFDYRCGYCKRVLHILNKVAAENPNVRVVYKELPILGPESILAARAALAVANQGQYVKFHNALMNSPSVDMDTIERLAKEAGVDSVKMKADMGSNEISAILAKNVSLAGALHIGATPTFIIGSELYPGAMDEDGFKRMIAKAQAK